MSQSSQTAGTEIITPALKEKLQSLSNTQDKLYSRQELSVLLNTNFPCDILLNKQKIYSVEKTLGKGMFGEVSLARDLETGEKYALKTFELKSKFEEPFQAWLPGFLEKTRALITDLQVKLQSAVTTNDEAKIEEYQKSIKEKDEFWNLKKEYRKSKELEIEQELNIQQKDTWAIYSHNKIQRIESLKEAFRNAFLCIDQA